MDSRGLACLFGMSVAVGACTTDVDPSDIFDPTTTGASTGTTSAATTAPVTTTSGDSSSSSTAADEASSSTAADGDSSSSDPGGSFCGDGVLEGSEDCDCGDDGECTEQELGGNACENLSDPLVPGVLTGGVLGCNPASCRYDTTQCVYCGDGVLNGNEVCELDQPIETNCVDLGKGTAGDLTCMDTCQVDTTACTECGYQFDFEGEDCAGDWVTLRTTGAASDETWECGDPTGGPAGKTGVWATNLTGNYSNDESSFVRSGVMDLSNCGGQTIQMTIRHWFEFQGGITNADGGIVQVTTGDPTSLKTGWNTVEPNGGVLYLPAVSASFPPVSGNAAFSGNDTKNEGMWVESTFDLTEYSGETEFYIRFVFGSNGANVGAGWYIDDVEILGSGD